MEPIKLNTNVGNDRMSDSLLAAMEQINLINSSDSDIVNLDFSNVENISPLYALPLVMYMNGCEKETICTGLNDFLQQISFPIGIHPDSMRKSEFIATMEKYARKTYIPIVSFPATKDRDDEKDVILSTVESIIVQQLGIDSNVATGLKYMLGESIDNIIQHANSERGYIYAQANPIEGYVDICIADSGITLLGSYKSQVNNEIETDLEAIQAANRGISTKNLPNAENRGYGIITSKKMLINGLGGSFVMMSGNALHLYNSECRKFIQTPAHIRWNGTLVAFRLPYLNKKFLYINYIE